MLFTQPRPCLEQSTRNRLMLRSVLSSINQPRSASENPYLLQKTGYSLKCNTFQGHRNIVYQSFIDKRLHMSSITASEITNHSSLTPAYAKRLLQDSQPKPARTVHFHDATGACGIFLCCFVSIYGATQDFWMGRNGIARSISTHRPIWVSAIAQIMGRHKLCRARHR